MKRNTFMLLLAVLVFVVSANAAITHVGVNDTNTDAVGGPADGWFVDYGDQTQPEWTFRAGFGFELDGVFETDNHAATGGTTIGDQAILVTTISGLTPGQHYSVYVDYLSAVNAQWAVMAGLAPDSLQGFARSNTTIGANDHIGTDDASGRVTDLGISAYPNSNRNMYRGLLGVAAADGAGEIQVYLDDVDATSNFNRVWLDGVAYGDPIYPATVWDPTPEDEAPLVDKTTSLSWKTGLDAAGDPNSTILSHNLYIGDPDDPNLVPISPISVAITGTGSASYTPTSDLVDGVEYTWRVDEVLASGVITGPEWTFATTPDDLTPIVTAGSNYLTWLAELPQGVDATVDDSGEGDVADADIVWSFAGYPGKRDNRSMQMLDRTAYIGNVADVNDIYGNPVDPDLLVDWIGTDQILTNGAPRYGGDPMTITLTGLTSGTTYDWTSYHHDPRDQTGDFTVAVDGITVATAVDITAGTESPITTLELSFVSDGSPVEIVFDHNDVVSGFFAINGFILSDGSNPDLKVDFGRDNDPETVDDDSTPVAVGYDGYLALHEVEETFTAQDFTALGGTVTVEPTWTDSIETGTVNASVTKTNTGLASTADFTTDTLGTYTIQLTATDSPGGQSGSDTLEVEVVADACAAGKANGAEINYYDVVPEGGDCVVDLSDFAAFAAEWLKDVSETASVPY